MARKLSEYFAAGARQVWYFDPAARNCTVHTSPDSSTILSSTILGLSDTLTAPDILPGFSLSLAELYGELDKQLGRA